MCVLLLMTVIPLNMMLLYQYLKNIKLKFFFIITSPTTEIMKKQSYLDFQIYFFNSINNFYKKFYSYISSDYLNFLKKKNKIILFRKKHIPIIAMKI